MTPRPIDRRCKLWSHWRARKESATACAERYVQMFTALADVHPAFARWIKSVSKRTREEKLAFSMPPQADEIEKLVMKGRYYMERSRVPIERLGYRNFFGNHLGNRWGTFINGYVGAYNENTPIPNRIEFSLPLLAADNTDLIAVSTLRRVVAAVVTAWQPDAVEIGPSNYRKFELGWDYPFFRANWLLYVAPEFATGVTPPPEVVAEPMPGGGVLFVAAEQPLDPEDPSHVAVVEALQVALQPAEAAVAEFEPELTREIHRRRQAEEDRLEGRS